MKTITLLIAFACLPLASCSFQDRGGGTVTTRPAYVKEVPYGTEGGFHAIITYRTPTPVADPVEDSAKSGLAEL